MKIYLIFILIKKIKQRTVKYPIIKSFPNFENKSIIDSISFKENKKYYSFQIHLNDDYVGVSSLKTSLFNSKNKENLISFLYFVEMIGAKIYIYYYFHKMEKSYE